MALSYFEDKGSVPKENELQEILGAAWRHWMSIKHHTENTYQNVNEEWKHYGKASGWTLLMKQKKRTLYYLFPCQDHFIIQFVFGEKAAEEAEKSNLSEEIKQSIREAKPYIEGRSFRVTVRSTGEIAAIEELIKIKVEY
ncbi:MAG: DUF3788 family protein [Bacillota bacterium]